MLWDGGWSLEALVQVSFSSITTNLNWVKSVYDDRVQFVCLSLHGGLQVAILGHEARRKGGKWGVIFSDRKKESLD